MYTCTHYKTMYQHTVNQQNVCNSQKIMVSKMVYASVLNIPVSEQLTLIFFYLSSTEISHSTLYHDTSHNRTP